MLPFLLLYSWFHLTTSTTKTQTTINAQTVQSTSDISISLNSHSVAISNTNYYINVQSQNAYDIKLSLSNKYSFDPYYNSTFTLTINGNTPFPNADSDVLIVFSVGDLQYFSFFLHLDTNNIRSRIYPSIMLSKNVKNVSEWIENTIRYPQRWHRLSNNDEWIQLSEWRNQALWPLKFIIENNPIKQYSNFKFFHNLQNTNELAISYLFNAAFLGDKKMDIYIMGDSKNEQFIINSFNIQLQNTAPTMHPTIIPTISPTISPTLKPTYSPIYLIYNSIDTIIDAKINTNSSNSEKDNAHILIFTIFISVASFVVLLQIFCMIKKKYKQKYRNNIAPKSIGNHNEHIKITNKIANGYDMNECKHDAEVMQIIEQEMSHKNNGNDNGNGNRKATTSTTERFEYNLDGRRTEVDNFELKRPNSETINGGSGGGYTNTYAYGHGIHMHAFGKRNYFYNYEGIKGINDDGNSVNDNSSGGGGVENTVTNECETNHTIEFDNEESVCGLMDAQTAIQYWKNHVGGTVYYER